MSKQTKKFSTLKKFLEKISQKKLVKNIEEQPSSLKNLSEGKEESTGLTR